MHADPGGGVAQESEAAGEADSSLPGTEQQISIPSPGTPAACLRSLGAGLIGKEFCRKA